MNDQSAARPKTSPKDFFLHLLNIIMLYISAYSFGQLLFFLINYYFPDVLNYGYDYFWGGFEQVRWSVSALIVAFPAYIIGAKALNSDYAKNPEKKNLRVKQWLEYLTLFGTALIILITFMTVVYKFLGGEITTRFLLKALTIVYISGSMFVYYLLVVKYGIEQRAKQVRIFTLVISVTILAAIVGGFVTMGSPKTERLRQFDRARIERLQTLVNTATYYYQRNQRLARTIDELQAEAGYPVDFTNPDTNEPLVYRVSTGTSFEVCGVFATERPAIRDVGINRPLSGKYDVYNQPYQQGEQCFTFTINPADFPPLKQ